MQEMEVETFCPVSRQAWRQWLKKNHSVKQSVWLIYYKKSANQPTISWSEAVEEALCFGWIDSVKRSLDDERFTQFFCRRKPDSVWSKINKEKVQRLTAQKLMTKAGLHSVAVARHNGSWMLLDEVEEMIIPEDLDREFRARPGSGDFFLSLSKSVRKAMLQWVVMAKQQETRQRRIIEIAVRASQRQKPKPFLRKEIS